MEKQNVHFIAIGGSVMHNLALALHEMGHRVTGSDDHIYDPAKSRLSAKGILPQTFGWDPMRIHAGLDAVILGMHAKADNPELLKARELGLKVYSFPAYLYEQSKDKQRVVIAGSHGKTTITSMVMHALLSAGKPHDYMVGALLKGYETMVGLTHEAPVIILEGDEYLTSPLDRRPKFLVYQGDVVLISGIAWDHINVFPTQAEYNRQFELLIEGMKAGSVLIYNTDDAEVKHLAESIGRARSLKLIPYGLPPFRIQKGHFELIFGNTAIPLQIIGRHNLSNMAGAMAVCQELGLSRAEFLSYMTAFEGASLRLERFFEDDNNLIFRDFAHSPSKVKATLEAVTELYPDRNILACFELHTFSSLNKEFLSEYKDTLKALDSKIVFINKETLKQKGYPPISETEIQEAFNDEGIKLAGSSEEVLSLLREKRLSGVPQKAQNVFLMMSSGNFGGLDLHKILE